MPVSVESRRPDPPGLVPIHWSKRQRPPWVPSSLATRIWICARCKASCRRRRRNIIRKLPHHIGFALERWQQSIGRLTPEIGQVGGGEIQPHGRDHSGTGADARIHVDDPPAVGAVAQKLKVRNAEKLQLTRKALCEAG